MTGQEAALEFFQEQEEVKKHDLRINNSNDLEFRIQYFHVNVNTFKFQER